MNDELYAWGVFLGDLLARTDRYPEFGYDHSPFFVSGEFYEDISVWINSLLQQYPYQSIYLGMHCSLVEAINQPIDDRGNNRYFFELEEKIKSLEMLIKKNSIDGNSTPYEIDFKGYWVTALPASIGALQSLAILDFTFAECNNFERWNPDLISIGPAVEIPCTIGNLKNLTTLTISNHLITILPESLCELTQLRKLDISWLHLQKLPESLGQLKKLEYLSIIDDQLEVLPESIIHLENLKMLQLVGKRLKLNELQFKWINSLKSAGCKVEHKAFVDVK